LPQRRLGLLESSCQALALGFLFGHLLLELEHLLLRLFQILQGVGVLRDQVPAPHDGPEQEKKGEEKSSTGVHFPISFCSSDRRSLHDLAYSIRPKRDRTSTGAIQPVNKGKLQANRKASAPKQKGI
jgi:hypothetical protein